MICFLRYTLFTFCVIIFSTSVHALSLPASEDTGASPSGHLTRNAGKVSTLSVAPNRPAFVRFDVAGYADSVNAEDIIRARLTFYIARARKPGALGVHAVTTDWAEAVDAKTLPPAFDESALATVSQELVREKRFVTVDVTEKVKSWLNTPAGDFGFAITSMGETSVVLASKEGPGIGQTATLEIDTTVARTVENTQLGFGIDVGKLGDGSVTNAEFQWLSGTVAPVQGQFTTLTETTANLALGLETKVNKTGDILTGALHLPADGLTVGSDSFAFSNGRVGLGTTAPQPDARLDVRGNIRFGPSGNHFTTGSEENLCIVRGTVHYENAALTIIAGGGFTTGPITNGRYTVTFPQPFSGEPTVSVTLEIAPGGPVTNVAVLDVTPAAATIVNGAALNGCNIHIVAIGPR